MDLAEKRRRSTRSCCGRATTISRASATASVSRCASRWKRPTTRSSKPTSACSPISPARISRIRNSNAVEIAVGGKAIQFVRVTATKLAKRLPTDFNFALAELEVLDASGTNVARRAQSDGGRFHRRPSAMEHEESHRRQVPQAIRRRPIVERLQRERQSLIDASLSIKERHRTPDAHARSSSAIALARHRSCRRQQTAYIGAVHYGIGQFHRHARQAAADPHSSARRRHQARQGSRSRRHRSDPRRRRPLRSSEGRT